MMNWEDFRYFAVLARTGSLSKAAALLKVDHATVARRTQSLETALGVRLIDRLPRRTILTQDGERIAALLGKMEEEAFAIERAARGADETIGGEVVVSAPPGLASGFLAPRLTVLRKRFPGLRLVLIGETRSAALDRREADIALRLTRPQGSGLVIRKLATLGLALYCKRGYVDKRDPKTWEFIVYDDSLDSAPQQQWLRAFAANRKIAFRSNDIECQRAAVRAGMGIAILPCYFGDRDRALQRLASDELPITRDLWLVVHDDLRRSATIRTVLDFLVEITQENRPFLLGA